MPRTLLVDTNRATYPVYRELCALGHEVWVVGGKPNEPLAKLAEHYEQLDYSDTEALSRFVDSMGFDFLVPGCTDLSYKVCAEINDGRFKGLDSPETTRVINEKHEFREVARGIGLPVPAVLTREQAEVADAVIVKPVDSFSGKGIEVVRDVTPEKLAKAVAAADVASPTAGSIIEEFVEGQLFSHSAFVVAGQVVTDVFVQEDCTANAFAVDTSRVDPDFPESMGAALRKNVETLAASLQLVDGLVHSQFIVSGDRYWIIEVTRRCPGDLYSLLIEFSNGQPYAANYASGFLGCLPVAADSSAAEEWIIRHTVTSPGGMSLWGLEFRHPVELKLMVPLASSGDFLQPSPAGRAAIFFLRASSADEQHAQYQQLLSGDLYDLA
ncbi:ATP-grasp domain-containing protein [Haloferula rosea]|uniref:ATP-grasp domain-containing protein n=1 Tax=Haloferula rosea TaxID=490093 RepID=A0A934VFY1_9BACT|nr:ATP-grasp domain-containing protein [Haloferula rosea]MBK1827521.1 ATP-grasp domain-containing protein [Haloferula rosea]